MTDVPLLRSRSHSVHVIEDVSATRRLPASLPARDKGAGIAGPALASAFLELLDAAAVTPS